MYMTAVSDSVPLQRYALHNIVLLIVQCWIKDHQSIETVRFEDWGHRLMQMYAWLRVKAFYGTMTACVASLKIGSWLLQMTVANAAKTAIQRVYGTEYTVGSASEVLCKYPKRPKYDRSNML